MIVTAAIAGRIAAITFGVLILQLAFFSEVSVAGSTPDIVPALVVTMGLLGGAVIGAVFGFAIGLAVDTALLQTLGASSLALLGAGYLAGRIRETWDIGFNSLVPLLIVGALTLVGAGGFALIQFMLGVDAPVSGLVIRDLLVKSILNVFLAAPIYFGVKRLLRSALIEDGVGRRRRSSAPTLGLGAT